MESTTSTNSASVSLASSDSSHQPEDVVIAVGVSDAVVSGNAVNPNSAPRRRGPVRRASTFITSSSETPQVSDHVSEIEEEPNNRTFTRLQTLGRRYWMVGAVLVIGAAITAWLVTLTINIEMSKRGELYRESVHLTGQNLQFLTQHHGIDISSFSAHMSLEPDMTYQKFVRLNTETFREAELVWQAVEWVPSVLDEDRARFEDRACRDFCEVLNFTETPILSNSGVAKQSPLYFPVYYIYPLEGNERAFLYDLYSNEARKKTIDMAIETRQLQMTSRITLVQEGSQANASYAVLVVKATDNWNGTGSNKVHGAVVGVLRVREMMHSMVRRSAPVNSKVYLFEVPDSCLNVLHTVDDYGYEAHKHEALHEPKEDHSAHEAMHSVGTSGTLLKRLSDTCGAAMLFLHHLQTDTQGRITMSSMEASNDPAHPGSKVCLSAIENARFVGEVVVGVHGHEWLLVMTQDGSSLQLTTPWVLLAMMCLATVFLSILVAKTSVQNWQNTKLREASQLRLEILERQQFREHAQGSSNAVFGLLKVIHEKPSASAEERMRRPSGARRSSDCCACRVHNLKEAAIVYMKLCYRKSTRLEGADKTSKQALRNEVEAIYVMVVQDLLRKHHGSKIDSSEEDGLQTFAGFADAADAVGFVMAAREALRDAAWPSALLQLSGCHEQRTPNGVLIVRGPRLSCAIHWEDGQDTPQYNLAQTENETTVQLESFALEPVSRLGTAAYPGQTLVSGQIAERIIGRLHLCGYPYLQALTHVNTTEAPGSMLVVQVHPPLWDHMQVACSFPELFPQLRQVKKSVGMNLTRPPPETAPDGSPLPTYVVAFYSHWLTGQNSKIPSAIPAMIVKWASALAQEFDGYVCADAADLDRLPSTAPTIVAFKKAHNAVCFCTGLQMALLHVMWDPADEEFFGRQEFAANGLSIFRGPRIAMFVQRLTPGKFTWTSPTGISQFARSTARHSVLDTPVPRHQGVRLVHGVPLDGSGAVEMGGRDGSNHPSQVSRAALRTRKSTANDSTPNVSDSEGSGVCNDWMQLEGPEVVEACLTVKCVSGGQIVTTASILEGCIDQLPGEFHPLDLGSHVMYPGGSVVHLVEISVSHGALLHRSFQPLKSVRMLSPGFYDSPDSSRGIAMLCCEVENLRTNVAARRKPLTEAIGMWENWLQKAILQFGAYECRCPLLGCSLFAFQTLADAVSFALQAQKDLLRLPYPKSLLEWTDFKQVKDSAGNVVLRGLRVRMGVSFGYPAGKHSLADGRANYLGSLSTVASRCMGAAQSGQVLVDGAELVNAQGDVPDTFAAVVNGNFTNVGMFKLMETEGPVPLLDAQRNDIPHRTFEAPNPLALVSADSGDRRDLKDRVASLMQEIHASSNDHGIKPVTGAAVKVTIQALLGTGGFATVYRGVWKGVTVAYKIARYNLGNDERTQETMAVMETAISATMTHPNVVQTYGFHVNQVQAADTDAECCEIHIIQEYCDRMSLRSALNHQHFASEDGGGVTDFEIALHIARDVARGMMHVHSMNVIHGDLKPQNVLLLSSYGKDTNKAGVVAKVADFGLSRKMALGETHVSGWHNGTYTHMAPEVYSQGHLSKAADVYAFGILLYELYTGKKAYKEIPLHQLMHETVGKNRRPVFPAQAPFQLVKLATECWSPNPGERPTFEQLVQKLDSLIETQKRAVAFDVTGSRRRFSSDDSHRASVAPGLESVQSSPEPTNAGQLVETDGVDAGAPLLQSSTRRSSDHDALDIRALQMQNVI